MTSTDIKLASNALILLGHQPISSFTEPTAGAEVASNLYESSYKTLLTQYMWRFATKKAVAARLSTTPINEFDYMYQIPTDCLYLIETSDFNYELFEDKIYSNSAELNIEYIYDVSPDRLPAYYVKMFEFFLASQFSIPVTGDMNKADLYYKMYEKQLRIAKFTDASQRPNNVIESTPYTDVRN
jgi:hypothetical protein